MSVARIVNALAAGTLLAAALPAMAEPGGRWDHRGWERDRQDRNVEYRRAPRPVIVERHVERRVVVQRPVVVERPVYARRQAPVYPVYEPAPVAYPAYPSYPAPVTYPSYPAYPEPVAYPDYRRHDEPNIAGAAVGAVIGGVIGNQVGGPYNRGPATAIGAVIGGVIGSQF
jgi:hypothetical protein